MSPESEKPQRTGSMGSLKSLVSSLRKVSTSGSQKSDGPSKQLLPDELPHTREGLEARLNYHLGELDRLRKLVYQRNDEIKEISYRLQIHQRTREEVPRSLQKLKELLDNVRQQRNSYAHFVDYHRGEIRRIGQRREELDLSQGIQPATKDMYKAFEREAEWVQLFSV
ncbi:uncharacterized protein A1O9_02429 [Exophiala aquamarina CBS 119918]|uniref:Uncharacterized protein n=1 Tax=Exophiala aquamarina CBS 119918 TaxID=1182545 RepID=A0A072PMA7_9EURO|nr:uncharacterized protein A1O9_02429 [Exophiala aquamarina CBS 119918]KEF60867.1 hypothetical protein A1O9_02429 [Exophiala aquamarina CBS 119918]